jgi:hypothetical protein
MNRFGILLDSGAIIVIFKKRRGQAREAYEAWKRHRREAMQRGDIVSPRRAVGFVRFKQKRKAP